MLAAEQLFFLQKINSSNTRAAHDRQVRELHTNLGTLYEAAEDWQKALETVAGLSGVHEAQTYGESIHLLVDSGKRRLPEIEKAMRKSQLGYLHIRIAPIRMEEAFISLIRKMEA